MAKRLPSFSPRPQQTELALAIQRALCEKRALIAEAGTGVGKSLAYLIPCSLWAARHHKKIVVATYTRALQEQLVAKELPLVQALLHEKGLPFHYAPLMGGENYLCVQRLNRRVSQGKQLFDPDEVQKTLHGLRTWSAVATTTGLRSKIPFPVSEPLWQQVCRDLDLCLGKRGPSWKACLYRKDLARARQADLVVIPTSAVKSPF